MSDNDDGEQLKRLLLTAENLAREIREFLLSKAEAKPQKKGLKPESKDSNEESK